MVLVSKSLSHKATSEAASDILYLLHPILFNWFRPCDFATTVTTTLELLRTLATSSVEGQHLRVPQPNIALQKLQRSVELWMHLRRTLRQQRSPKMETPNIPKPNTSQYTERSPAAKDDSLDSIWFMSFRGSKFGWFLLRWHPASQFVCKPVASGPCDIIFY